MKQTSPAARRGRPSTHDDIRATAWSAAFRAHLAAKGITQTEAALALGVSKNHTHYWCRGTLPKDEMRARIETWSDGAVRA